jgi:tetratricopeptide (TPR) repeat protein
MSLLMEALKKAERAKQAALEQGGEQAAPQTGELQLTPNDPAAAAAASAEGESAGAADETPAAAASPHPLLRDPRQSRLDFPRLELESIDDREFDLDPVKPRQARTPDASEDRNRAAARTVFEAKHPDSPAKNRTPLIIGALALLLGIGIAGYFWKQLQGSGSGLTSPQLAAGAVAPRPPMPPAPVPVAVAAATPAPAAASPVAPLPSPPVLVSAADTPAAAAQTDMPPVAKARPRIRLIPAATDAAPATRPRAIATGTQRDRQRESQRDAKRDTPSSQVRISPSGVTVNPVLDAAYRAYLANDFTSARNNYNAVLERDPANRDALLGLAGIAAREHHNDEAETLYIRILRADPTDPYAQTGLISVRGEADPVTAESRLKTLLAAEPNAAYLHYALGNLYARQKRWNDAEQEHFRAFALDSDNADYCYNLAVALDQLRQPKPALTHYERALVLAAAKPASFDPARLRARISELQKQL